MSGTTRPLPGSSPTGRVTHTPGPWRVEFQENGGYDCMTDAWKVVAGDGPIPQHIVTVDLGDYGQPPCDESVRPPLGEANARLIAAAPNLLRMLAHARSELCGQYLAAGGDEEAKENSLLARMKNLLDVVDKVIADAEGR
jgi:hypothetical protein